jgi:hypothetical protein
MLKGINKDNPVIAWWSGGADSAIVCWLCILWFGKENVRIVFIDVKRNEHPDTYRFKIDCETWWGVEIETISSNKWDTIWEVWRHFGYLNTATGAICSSELKRAVRQDFQNKNNFSYQAFGYDIDATEVERAIGMKTNYPDSKPIFPLIYQLINKKQALKMLIKEGIAPPITYEMGYQNNNCYETGCVKGGIGYWQKRKIDEPEKFDTMADFEHELTEQRGEPVTICKDQSKNAKKRNGGKAELVFLKHNPLYPLMKDISMMNGRMPEPLMECNAWFCKAQ